MGEEHNSDREGFDLNLLARGLYWISLLLLLVGAWLLILPFERRAGETSQIYITLGSYEIYIWVLLILGRWQNRKGLHGDVARSGIFSLVLIGLVLMAVNELHLVSSSQGIVASVVFLILGAIKLYVGPRFFRVSLPLPFLLMGFAWLVALTLPAVLLSATEGYREVQHTLGYFCYWFVALLFLPQMLLIRWQRRHEWISGTGELDYWWTPWVIVMVLCILAILQVPSTLWSGFVKMAPWYYNPVLIALAAFGIALANSRKNYRHLAWGVMALSILFCLGSLSTNEFDCLPKILTPTSSSLILNPLHLYGFEFIGFMIVAAWCSGTLWLYAISALPIIVLGTKHGILWTCKTKHGKGICFLLGAFITLAAGIAVQWWFTRHPRKSWDDQEFSAAELDETPASCDGAEDQSNSDLP